MNFFFKKLSVALDLHIESSAHTSVRQENIQRPRNISFKLHKIRFGHYSPEPKHSERTMI